MKKERNVFGGLLLIAIAVLLIMNHMGYLNPEINFTPALIAALFISVLSRGFGLIFFPLALVWMVFGNVLGLPEVSEWLLLFSALLLTAGFSAIFPRFGKRNSCSSHWEAYEDGSQKGEHQTIVDDNKNNRLFFTNRFGATEKHVSTPSFQGGDLTNEFGEAKIFFDDVTITVEPIDIDVHVAFGSMQLFVPKEWRVERYVKTFAASINENNHLPNQDSPLVRLHGEVNFGELTITYI